MNKYISTLLVSVFSVSLVVCSSSAMQNNPENLGKRLIDFLVKFDPSSVQDVSLEIKSLFSPDLDVTVKSIEEMKEEHLKIPQEWEQSSRPIIEFYEENCILFPQDKFWALQFEVSDSSKDYPHYISIIFIKYNEDGLITDINTVDGDKKSPIPSVRLQERNTDKEIDSEELKRSARCYIKSLQGFGKEGYLNTFEASDEMKDLFSEDCSILINGEIECNSFHAFNRHLLKIKDIFGLWTIDFDEESVVASPQHSICMVGYNITTEKYFRHSEKRSFHVVVAYLKFDENGKIYEINEVSTQRYF